jgi:hypothetical protein
MENLESFSFWQLLKEKTVEIPIIQRDYAQGRTNSSAAKQPINIDEIRSNFLDFLFARLKNEKAIELDFIYGNNNHDNTKYQLLDGQQRLTTLFLLHWYAACKDGKLSQNADILRKFTYETRISSREFCVQLVTDGIDFKKLLPSSVFDKESPIKNDQISKTIRNSSWFVMSWNKDPTINSMLNMLDAIHEKADKITNLWCKLTVEGRITFLNMPLENFGLSDDLYIKMNARGKSLSEFENFKATIERIIKSKNWENSLNDEREKFAFKADTLWTDLLWKYRDENNNIDRAFYRLMNILILCSFATRKETEKIIQRIKDQKSVYENIKKTDYEFIMDALDSYCAVKIDEIQFDFTFWGKYIGGNDAYKNFFLTVIKEDDPTWSQIALFYAQTKYLLDIKNCDGMNFQNWMRVIRNLVENQDVDSSATFISAIGRIDDLSRHCKDIYAYLASLSKPPVGFAGAQLEEEIFKAKIIKQSSRNRNVVFETEDTNFCRGYLKFPFFCIDCEYDVNKFNAGKLDGIKRVIKEHLDGDDISNDFRRALLTIGDNNFYCYWRSWLHAVSAPKYCLIANARDLYNFAYNREDYRQYLKTLLDQLTTKKLIDIIKDYPCGKAMPHWKKEIIKKDKLLDHSYSHYIAVKEDDSCCWLIPGSRVSNNKWGKERLLLIKYDK